MEIQLTKHFKLSEFLISDKINSINNITTRNNMLVAQSTLDYWKISSLYLLCCNVLEPAREKLGFVITVSSGYRCKRLNEIVKGVSNSQHLYGQAADITCIDNKALYDVLVQMDFDQLIVYGPRVSPRFIHVSYATSASNRHQVFFKP